MKRTKEEAEQTRQALLDAAMTVFHQRGVARASLDQIATYLKADAGARLHVVGHTDSVGGFDSNLALSRRRAEAVVAALGRDYGIAASRLQPNGVASLAPVASNAAEEGRAKNRRVELVLQ